MNWPKFEIRKSVVLIALIMLSACSGGGGGGDESSDAHGIRVLHAAIDGAPVDLISSTSSSPVLSQIVFAGSHGYRSLSSQAQSITLTRAKTPSEVIGSFDLLVSAEDKYTLLLYGDHETFGLRTRLLKDEAPLAFSGSVVRIVNGTTGASRLSVTVGSTTVPIAFGEASDYLEVASGQLSITAARASDGYPVQAGSVSLEPGRSYTFLIAGEVAYYVKGVLFLDS